MFRKVHFVKFLFQFSNDDLCAMSLKLKDGANIESQEDKECNCIRIKYKYHAKIYIYIYRYILHYNIYMIVV